MDQGERTTGTRDEHFNLVSVLYHALQAADTIEAYIFDAETAGNERLAAFLREAQDANVQIAERAKALLGIPETPGDVPPDDTMGGMSPGDMSGG